jgi:hypothetical protein
MDQPGASACVGLENPSRRLIKLRGYSRQTSSKCFTSYGLRSDGPSEVLNRSRTASAHPVLTFSQQAGSARSVWRRSRYARYPGRSRYARYPDQHRQLLLPFAWGWWDCVFLACFVKELLRAMRHFDTSHREGVRFSQTQRQPVAPHRNLGKKRRTAPAPAAGRPPSRSRAASRRAAGLPLPATCHMRSKPVIGH